MEFVMEKATIFMQIVQAIELLAKDVLFLCDHNGIKMQSRDVSNVTLIDVVLNAEGFQKYICKERYEMGVNLASFLKILKNGSKGDSLHVKAGEDTIIIKFKNASSKSRRFGLKLLNIEVEWLGCPSNPYQAVLTTPSKSFSDDCASLIDWSDVVNLTFTRDRIIMKIGGEICSGDITITPDETEHFLELDIDVEKLESQFSLPKLVAFTKATPLAQTLVISMSETCPLFLNYTIPDLGWLHYYLSPKIEEVL